MDLGLVGWLVFCRYEGLGPSCRDFIPEGMQLSEGIGLEKR